ncbi:MAG: hypothetical protein LBI45_00615 [Bacteroidales bacterium]|jgi:hypothetical protein|nr:hypothetical protein [Bacteroidales bacterium]
MFGKLALKAALPSLLSQLEGGVLEDFLLGLRADYAECCIDAETVELLQTMEKVNGQDVAMLNVVALDENCCVRMIKQYTIKELIEFLKTKI